MDISDDIYHDIIVDLSRTSNVDEDMASHPAVYGYYHGILSKAKREVDMQSLHLEVQEARLKMNICSKGKKASHIVEAEVQGNPEIAELNLKLIRAKEVYNLIKSICSTLEHRKDMLVQLSANKRMETKLFS